MFTRILRGQERLIFLTIVIALHVVVAIGASQHLLNFKQKDKTPDQEVEVFFIKAELPKMLAPAPDSSMSHQEAAPAKTQTEKPLATMAAPSAPSSNEWAFAAKYTNKNSKGYRHSWGQQVRSMMGTAVEGPDQGEVRFRIEISPNGTLTQLDTLWSTSALAEKLARQAIENMPTLPPTPTGKPLIFEKTISFSPFASDDKPTYKDDCLPDTPTFNNPFAWDGKSEHVRTSPPPAKPKLDAQAMEECLRKLPKDSIEAEMARDQRLMDQWGSSKTGR